jgi:hypothetical protein
LFDIEKIHKFTPKNILMAIYTLSGLEQDQEQLAELGRKKKGKKGGLFKKVFKPVAKVGLAPARGAFLVLVSLNFAKLANKLYKVYQKDPNKVIKFWQKFGGDWNKLKKAIAKGSKKSISGLLNGDPQVGLALQSAIATATPIVVDAIKMFKEAKIKDEPDDSGNTLESAERQGKQLLAQQGDIETKELPAGTKVAAEVTETSDTKQATQRESQGGSGSNTGLLIGGGAALLLLLLANKQK